MALNYNTQARHVVAIVSAMASGSFSCHGFWLSSLYRWLLHSQNMTLRCTQKNGRYIIGRPNLFVSKAYVPFTRKLN